MLKHHELENSLIKRYKIRSTGRAGCSIETTIPKEVFEREVRKRGITIEEALDSIEAVWHYSDSVGLLLTFEEAKKR